MVCQRSHSFRGRAGSLYSPLNIPSVTRCAMMEREALKWDTEAHQCPGPVTLVMLLIISEPISSSVRWNTTHFSGFFKRFKEGMFTMQIAQCPEYGGCLQKYFCSPISCLSYLVISQVLLPVHDFNKKNGLSSPLSKSHNWERDTKRQKRWGQGSEILTAEESGSGGS